MNRPFLGFTLLFMLFGLAVANAACTSQNHATCGTTSLGNSVTCHEFFVCNSSNSSETTNTVTVAPTTGNGVYIETYLCKFGASCPLSGSAVTLTYSDNINNPETCFTNSPNSPFTVTTTNNSFLQYEAYCPSIPSGVTSITMTASGTSGFMTTIGFDASGMCATNPCWDTDALNNQTSASVTTSTVSTPGTLNFTNELAVAFFTNNNNHTFTADSPYVPIEEAGGNFVETNGLSNMGRLITVLGS